MPLSWKISLQISTSEPLVTWQVICSLSYRSINHWLIIILLPNRIPLLPLHNLLLLHVFPRIQLHIRIRCITEDCQKKGCISEDAYVTYLND
jgi:hypothetical protein